MRVTKKPVRSVLVACAVAFALTTGVVAGGCGDDDTPSASTSVTTGVVSGSTVSVPASMSATDTTEADSSQSTTTLTAPAAGAVTTTGTLPSTTEGATTTAVVATTGTAGVTTTAQPTTTTAKAPTALTVRGPAGVEELSMAELKAMPATSGYGGWKNELTNITAPASWKGVSVTALMELVGGGSSVVVVASDGYSVTLSTEEVRGGVNTYDPATGEPVGGVNVRAIVAYAKGGSALGSGEGPLRIAFVSAENSQVTDSDMWVKYVVELKVH